MPASPRFGVDVRLVGRVYPDPRTGQLTAVIDDNPQAAVQRLHDPPRRRGRGCPDQPADLRPAPDPHSACPMDGHGSGDPGDSFVPSARRPGLPMRNARRAPVLHHPLQQSTARPAPGRRPQSVALPLRRPDGAQELRRVELTLPPGMVARLRGSSTARERDRSCGAAQRGERQGDPGLPAEELARLPRHRRRLRPAAARRARARLPCRPLQGRAGQPPLRHPGARLPHASARSWSAPPCHVDPETAQVKVVSDPIPDVFGGVKLGIRAIDVTIRRPRFTVNPTTCREEFPIRSDAFGGGANPATPPPGSASPTTTSPAPTTAVACASSHASSPPRLRRPSRGCGARPTRASARSSARARATPTCSAPHFVLPKSIILDQAHIRTICTRVQLAASECPLQASIYGFARATSPLLDGEPTRVRSVPDLIRQRTPRPARRPAGPGQHPPARERSAPRAAAWNKVASTRPPTSQWSKFILNMRGGNQTCWTTPRTSASASASPSST